MRYAAFGAGGLAAVLALAWGLAGCERKPEEKKASGPPPALITVTQVKRGGFDVVEETLGTLEALIDPKIGAEVAGRVATVHAGTGKAVRKGDLLATLDAGWASAYIPNPNLEPRALVLAIAEELAVPMEPDVDQHHLLRGITRVLLDHARHARRVVLCMDESQGMPLETLETLRLLTNLETEKRKLLQVVLFGQPELDRKLAS